MALVLICGQPCSGKSMAALCLAEALKESGCNQAVRVIDETSFHVDRNESCANMPAEKNLRGVLRLAVSVPKDSIIIVDSLNSIKGYSSYLTKKADSKSWDAKTLQPTIATQNTRFSEANSLYELDRATQEVIHVIVEAQFQSLGGPLNGVSVGQGLPPINISRAVELPELRRLQRTFIKLMGQTSLSGPPPPSDADNAKRMFVDYLNRELETA